MVYIRVFTIEVSDIHPHAGKYAQYGI
jgi:hypothetical protein